MTQLQDLPFVSVGMTQIPSLLLRTGWTNHQLILQRCFTIDQYIFYILYAEYEHLKNKELERAIKSDTYSRMLNDKLTTAGRNQPVFFSPRYATGIARRMSRKKMFFCHSV